MPKPDDTVLVIDDDAEARELLARSLSREGIKVVCAASAAEGLSRARESRPAVITLDVLMPEMDGWSFLDALKADTALADIPVVMVSASDERTRASAAGVVAYLAKPVDRGQLVAAIRRAGGQGRSPTALVVEDDSDNRELLCRLLRRDGWTVSEAADGAVGLQQLAEGLPDLILLDLDMPRVDGYSFVQELQASPELRAIPVVVVSAQDLTEEDRRRLPDPVRKIFLKGSYTRDQLMRELRGILAGRPASPTASATATPAEARG